VGTSGAAETFLILASGLVGLVVGSFLNVVIYRLPLGLSLVRPPSRCPACETRLTALDMVPVVSWLVLRGRCRHCGARIAPRYPLVELATGVVFAGTAAALGRTWPLVPVLVLAACALSGAVLDADGADLPRLLTTIAAVAAFALLPIAAVLGDDARIGWGALGAALTAVAAFAVDRASGPHRLRRVVLLAAVGGVAGVLWPGGGPFAAAWVVVASAATVMGAIRRAPLALLIGGSYAAVLASAVIGHH